MRTQFARMRINNLKLFFNTECKLLEHASGELSFSMIDSSHTPYRVSPNGSELTVSCFFFVGGLSECVSPASLATTFLTSPDETSGRRSAERMVFPRYF